MTAGSVGRERGAEQPARDPGEVEEHVRGGRDQRGRGERPEDAEREDRHRRAAEAAPADVEAALEEDHDQRDDADPLDGDEGDRVAEPRHEVGDHRRGDEEERGARDRQPFGDRAAVQRQRDPAGDDEHDQAEVWDLRHRVNLGVCEVDSGRLHFPYMNLTAATRAVPILRSMRKTFLCLALLALILPAAAARRAGRGRRHALGRGRPRQDQPAGPRRRLRPARPRHADGLRHDARRRELPGRHRRRRARGLPRRRRGSLPRRRHPLPRRRRRLQAPDPGPRHRPLGRRQGQRLHRGRHARAGRLLARRRRLPQESRQLRRASRSRDPLQARRPGAARQADRPP